MPSLLERRPPGRPTAAVEAGLQARAHRRDAIAQLLLPREDWRATTFSLDGREHPRQVVVASTDVAAYRALLAPGGAPWAAPGRPCCWSSTSSS